jgi:ketosteroid isomerase-like protein
MKQRATLSLGILVLVCLMFSRANAQGSTSGQESVPKPQNQELYDEIARMDAAMFDAFNAHDLEALMLLFSEKLEFYHDTGGLQSYGEVKASFKQIFDRKDGLRRELVKGSLEVYPIKDYGAIEIGTHRFRHTENGREEVGTFKFVHIWEKKEGKWRVTRVVSYGH